MIEETTADTPGTAPEIVTTEPLQTALEQEIERENKRGEGRSEAEKAAFSLKKTAERMKELGLDPAEVLGLSQVAMPIVDKDAPLTVGMYEQMQKDRSQKTAIELAEEITDQHERALTISYLKTRIVPSGDPEDDIRFARQAVNSVKNSQIVEEISRSVKPKNFSSGASAPAMKVSIEPELSTDELMFTKPPFNMTRAEIISKRPQI